MGGASANSLAVVSADRPPTPDPSPPRARARGGRGAESIARRCVSNTPYDFSAFFGRGGPSTGGSDLMYSAIAARSSADQLRGVADHAHHRSAGGIAIGRLPGLEEIGDVLGAPVAEPLLRDVRHPALAFRVRPPGETLRRDDAAEKIARAVALGAMAETSDEIGAAIPLRRTRRIRLNGLSSMNSNFQIPTLRLTLNGNGTS